MTFLNIIYNSFFVNLSFDAKILHNSMHEELWDKVSDPKEHEILLMRILSPVT